MCDNDIDTLESYISESAIVDVSMLASVTFSITIRSWLLFHGLSFCPRCAATHSVLWDL